MALTIRKSDGKKTVLEFENVVSVWNTLKYMVDVPYLKRFVVEKYEGGNMLVPREAWKEEGVMFKEIRPGVYLFPYDSIGFVIDDSIHNMRMHVLDQYGEGSNYRDQAEMTIGILNTDFAELVLDEKAAPKFSALYLLSAAKIGFDAQFLQALEAAILPVFEEGAESIEYLPASLLVGLKRISFLARVRSQKNGDAYYRLTYSGHRCRRDPVREKNLYNVSYLKKKLLKKNALFPVLYYGVLFLIPLGVFLWNKKLFLMLLGGFLAAWLVLKLVKKNAYKFLSKN